MWVDLNFISDDWPNPKANFCTIL